jgi:hypothetical protein
LSSASAHTPFAVTVDDTVHDRQTDPGAFELFLAVKSLKNPENTFGELHIKAYAVITHKVDVLTWPLLAANLHAGMFPLTGILQCIFNQIHEDLVQQSQVCLAGWQLIQDDFHLAVCVERLELN